MLLSTNIDKFLQNRADIKTDIAARDPIIRYLLIDIQGGQDFAEFFKEIWETVKVEHSFARHADAPSLDFTASLRTISFILVLLL